jgi:hypothetical protein
MATAPIDHENDQPYAKEFDVWVRSKPDMLPGALVYPHGDSAARGLLSLGRLNARVAGPTG